MDDICNDHEQKPHPKIYLLVAEKLKISPEKCLVIEDSKVGVEAAKRAGMFCIGYQNPNRRNQDISRSDIIISNLLKLKLENLLKL